MKFIQFATPTGSTLGVRRGDELIDLSMAAPSILCSLSSLLAMGNAALQWIDKVPEAADTTIAIQDR